MPNFDKYSYYNIGHHNSIIIRLHGIYQLEVTQLLYLASTINDNSPPLHCSEFRITSQSRHIARSL